MTHADCIIYYKYRVYATDFVLDFVIRIFYRFYMAESV